MTTRNVAHRNSLVRWAAALLFAPLLACAAPVGADQTPTTTQQAPVATAPIPVPAAASQETRPLPSGATTTGRPATPAVPAPAEQPATATPPAPAVATPAPGQRPPQVVMPASNTPATGSLLQTILALILVLGLLLGLAWFMKRYGPRAMGASANVKLVGALNIGGRERIMVVEVGNQWIVVGASPGRVNALATMPRQEGAQADGVQATLAGHNPTAGGFGDWLKNTIDKRNAK